MSTAAGALTTSPIRTGPRLLEGITTSFGLLSWFAILAQFKFLVPATEKWLLEYHLRVPGMTTLVIHDSWWIVPGIAVAAFATCMYLRKPWAWNFTLLVLPLLINLIVMLSLFVPTLALLAGITAGRGVAH